MERAADFYRWAGSAGEAALLCHAPGRPVFEQFIADNPEDSWTLLVRAQRVYLQQQTTDAALLQALRVKADEPGSAPPNGEPDPIDFFAAWGLAAQARSEADWVEVRCHFLLAAERFAIHERLLIYGEDDHAALRARLAGAPQQAWQTAEQLVQWQKEAYFSFVYNQ